MQYCETCPLHILLGTVAIMFNACSYEQPNTLNPWLHEELFYGSVEDIDGNTYATIKIGSQEWMAENLRTTRYQNGNIIQNVTDSEEWHETQEGAWCYYEHKIEYEIPHGKIYNWYVAVDSRNVCPKGWHIPSKPEWNVLIEYLGGEGEASNKMMSGWIDFHSKHDTHITNESGLSLMLSGRRMPILVAVHRFAEAGTEVEENLWLKAAIRASNSFGLTRFANIDDLGLYWIGKHDDSNNAIIFSVQPDRTDIAWYNAPEYYGHCIRCIRN
jgi:uncharacterized protein (TIGR02145 family)